MKNYLLRGTLIIVVTIGIWAGSVLAQNTFIYNAIEPKDNVILDAFISNDSVIAIQITIDTLLSSNLLVLNNNGGLLYRYKLGDRPFNAMRIVKKDGGDIYLLGRFKTDTCKSSIAIVRFNLNNEDLDILSEVPFCDKNVQNLFITDRLDSGWFISGYWVFDNRSQQTILLKMDSSFQITPFMDSLQNQELSVDFSRKGYLLKTQNLCYFYGKDFQYRKLRYNFQEGRFSIHQTHIPYGDNYILESYGAEPDYMNAGHYIRLVDSSLHIKKEVFVAPATPNEPGATSEPPFFKGIDFIDESRIWLAGNNNLSSNLSIPNHFSISRINEQLEIECNQYIGFDAAYAIYGLRATEDGGVLVYGMKYNGSYDPYIIKLGPNCELPTTSKHNPDNPLISISAYPNPGINELTFYVEGFVPASLRVEIVDVMGRLLYSTSDLTSSIQVPNLPAGQYFYRILQEDKLLGVGGWVKQ